MWKEYAYRQNIHPAVISYLGIKPQYFCQIETTVDGKRFATPRGWEDLSQFIQVYEKLGKRADRDVVYQYIQHPKIAKDFANYLELYYKYQSQYQVEEILAGVMKEELCDRVARAPFDERLSVTGLLLAKLTDSFKALGRKNQQMELLMEQMKHFRQELFSGEGTQAGAGAALSGSAVASVDSAAARPEPVSYTHLDVYKRQRQEMLWKVLLTALSPTALS